MMHGTTNIKYTHIISAPDDGHRSARNVLSIS